MVEIKYMDKPDSCVECPFFKKLYEIDRAGAYIKIYSCAFAYEYGKEKYQNDDEFEDFINNDAVHGSEELAIQGYVCMEPWCPIVQK